MISRGELDQVDRTATGAVSVTSHWADGPRQVPPGVRAYHPAARLAGGKADPRSRTEPELAREVIPEARWRSAPGTRAASTLSVLLCSRGSSRPSRYCRTALLDWWLRRRLPPASGQPRLGSRRLIGRVITVPARLLCTAEGFLLLLPAQHPAVPYLTHAPAAWQLALPSIPPWPV